MDTTHVRQMVNSPCAHLCVYADRLSKKMKTCTTCKTTKIPSDFYKSNQTNDGLERQCKKCRRRARISRNHTQVAHQVKDENAELNALCLVISQNCKPLTVRIVAPTTLIIFDKIGGFSLKCVPVAELSDKWTVTKTMQGKTIEKYGRISSAQIINTLNQLFPKQ